MAMSKPGFHKKPKQIDKSLEMFFMRHWFVFAISGSQLRDL